MLFNHITFITQLAINIFKKKINFDTLFIYNFIFFLVINRFLNYNLL